MLNGFNAVLGQNKYSDAEAIGAGREWMETNKKWGSVAEIVDIIMVNRQRIFSSNQQKKQFAQLSHVEEPYTKPSPAEKALYRYIFLSAFSSTPVSILGYEEYAMRVFGLDPDKLISTNGATVQSGLFLEPLRHDLHRVGEKWPQAGPPLPEKHYRDPWAKGLACAIAKPFPTQARGEV